MDRLSVMSFWGSPDGRFVGASISGSEWQTWAALAVVTLAVAGLVWRTFFRKKPPGCGDGACSAVSGEVRKLQRQLKAQERRN